MSDVSHSLLVWIVIGALAGWLASFVWRGHPYGIFRDLALGIAGACVASGIAHGFGLTITNSLFLDIVVSAAGALIVLVAVRALRQT